MTEELIGYRPCRRNRNHKAQVFMGQYEDGPVDRDCYFVECWCGFEARLSPAYSPEDDPEFE